MKKQQNIFNYFLLYVNTNLTQVHLLDFRKQGKEFRDTDRLITFRDFHFSTKYKQLHSNYQLNCFESPLKPSENV